MSFKVIVEPSGHQFTAEADEFILDAAERQGISLPYGCRDGRCGTCSGTLISGAVTYPEETQGTVDEKPDGYCLICKATPSSDLTIHLNEVESEAQEEIRALPCKVEKLEQLSHDVMRIYLKLPENERILFLAGQYLDFMMEDGRRRAFSIANAPHNDDLIELHIRHVPGGEFTDLVFNGMKPGDIFNIQAPMGGFYLRENSDRPLIFMAGGTGFAPLKGIIEHAIHIGQDRPIHLYWGVRAERDLYLGELASKWAEEQKNLTFVPVLSEPDNGWSGKNGWVHDAVLEDHPDMSLYDLYMSGPPVMVFGAKKAFMAAGMSEDNMFSDVFEWAQDNPDK